MAKKVHRVNARLSAKEYERARQILDSHKIYGVHTLSDVVSKAVWDLYDAHFPTELEKAGDVHALAAKYCHTLHSPPPAVGAESKRPAELPCGDDSAAKSPPKKFRKGRVRPGKPRPRKPAPKPHAKKKVKVTHE